MDVAAQFRGKKITVMGLGLLGRGVGDARYLASCGAELIVTDLKSKEALASSLEQLAEFPNITYVLGEHRLEDFRGRDYILKAAGVPLDSPFLQEAAKEGTPVKMSASWFAELAGIPVIGITGTRGKSTTTHMLHEILAAAGKQVILGGNVRGVSTLALLPEVTPAHLALFELDSWQLQGFGDGHMSPNISIFTTFYPDHLNYYHGNLEAYLADKANIFRYQNADDVLILGAQCSALVQEKYAHEIQGHVQVGDAANLPADWQLQIPGDHNRYAAALALLAARALEVPDAVSKHALEVFAGVPGRLEKVGVVQGITVYNDTTATTPDATLAALHSFPGEEQKTLLIMGGADKDLDMSELLAALPSSTKEVLLLAGTGTERIRSSLPEAPVFSSLQEAIVYAFAHASEGDILLFSPAFASFGMFANEYDRGDQFTALIRSYGN